MKKLLILALALAGINLAPAQTVDTRAADQLGWQLAIHSYTFQNFSIFDAIDMTSALGVKYMSVSGTVRLGTNRVATTSLKADQRSAIDEKLKAKGINLPFVNVGVVSLGTNEAANRKVFDFAKQWGINVLVSEPPTNALDDIVKLCKEYNIRVALHNHPKGHSIYWNPETVLEVSKNRAPWIGACADTGHWMRSDLDPLESLKKLEGHIIALHFKDLNEMGPKGHDVPWGTGVGRSRELLAEMKRQNFKGAFCIEYEYHWDNSSPEIAECVKFFNKVADELVAQSGK